MHLDFIVMSKAFFGIALAFKKLMELVEHTGQIQDSIKP
jgi:hypothetical protein